MALIQVDTLNDAQTEALWQLYQNEWWTNMRNLLDTLEMLKHTGIIIAFVDDESGELAAFCRILTDYVYKAVVLDVIVKAEYRKQGLGAGLMDAAVNHPGLSQVETIDLWCLDEMVPFYERWGFIDQAGKVRLMRKHHKDGTENDIG